ncbi:hypothetical protein F6X68_14495 [Micromonospora sp. AMSO12t]|uniref:hypothetical protein n=1 Tax=unclassified Micromonospora TaxID=2617518 RepID=UPI00124B9ADD|nr:MULTISPECIES: hypothetical protein [unclassified Micromonospora]KAB1153337.1 hypothetical protein F6X68_14495 [Micromonospora sp. AMSO12t]WSF99775.1 hypothetical protein OG989_18910 [Micromonospora sp. NBC_01740]
MTVYDIAAKLPPIGVLRDRCKALAVLECILDGSEPYYAYTRSWGDDAAALMNNGSGDEWAVVFTAEGAFIRVFDHESAMTPYRSPDRELWPGLLDGIPTVFRPQIEEPAFGDEEGQFLATAVLWRLCGDDRWHAGEGIIFPPLRGPYDDNAPDGSGLLEILLDDIVGRYVTFADDYYEIELDPTVVEHVVAHRPLTDAVVQALNPEMTVARLHEDIAAIGYSIATA